MATYLGDANYSTANGGCYVCARGDRLVDTDVQIVGEGALTICTGCISDLAEVAGLTFNEARVRELEASLATERAAREEAETVKKTLLDAVARAASKPKTPRNR